MDQKWKVRIYESVSGDKPVEVFIKSLGEKARTKVANTLDYLEEFGITLVSPHLKKLTGTSLWELRILGADSIRIFYITITGRIFLLLHGFKKKSQKTPKREIVIAQKRLEEYQGRNIKS